MIEFANKKNVKVVSLAIAAIFVIGAFAFAVRGAGLTGGSGGTTDSAIGKVNYNQLVQAVPGIQDAQVEMQKAAQDAESQYKEKSKDMSDADKQKLHEELQKGLEDKQKELVEPLKKKVDDAIVAVGKTKGLTVIVNEGAVVYGGLDVTADVQAELQKQAKKN